MRKFERFAVILVFSLSAQSFARADVLHACAQRVKSYGPAAIFNSLMPGGICAGRFAAVSSSDTKVVTVSNRAHISNIVMMEMSTTGDVQNSGVPEPGILMLFGFGLLGFGGIARRKWFSRLMTSFKEGWLLGLR